MNKLLIFCFIFVSFLFGGCANLSHQKQTKPKISAINKIKKGLILSRQIVDDNNTAIVQKKFEYTVKLNDGSTVTVLQSLDDQFVINQRVLIIFGNKPKIVADNQV